VCFREKKLLPVSDYVAVEPSTSRLSLYSSSLLPLMLLFVVVIVVVVVVVVVVLKSVMRVRVRRNFCCAVVGIVLSNNMSRTIVIVTSRA